MAEAKELGTIMDVVLGLRYDRELTKHLKEKIMNMIDLRESHGYQLILEEGEAKGKAEGRFDALRDIIMRQGKKKFGKPPHHRMKLETILSELADEE